MPNPPPTTRVRVLKPFALAVSVTEMVSLKTGDEFDIRTGAVDGLEREGYVSRELKGKPGGSSGIPSADIEKMDAAELYGFAKRAFNLDLIPVDDLNGFRGHVADELMQAAQKGLRDLKREDLEVRAKPLLSSDADKANLSAGELMDAILEPIARANTGLLATMDVQALLDHAKELKVEIVPAKALKGWVRQVAGLQKKAGEPKPLV